MPKVINQRVAQRVGSQAITESRVCDALLQGLLNDRRDGKIHVRDPHRQNLIRIAAPFFTAAAGTIQQRIEVKSHAVLKRVKRCQRKAYTAVWGAWIALLKRAS